MAITRPLSERVQDSTDLLARVDSGTTNPGARMVFRDSGQNPVLTIEFPVPSFVVQADASMVAQGGPWTPISAVPGNIVDFIVTDRDNGEKWTGSVGGPGSGADVILSKTDYVAGDTVTINDYGHNPPL